MDFMNNMDAEEKLKKRKNLIKNAAIIFLSVLLVLTFFSNTIMNYSLPQVATEYVQNDTITTKIRGTGAVEATDPYEVKAKDTRVIASVKVQKGDDVQKGDVLMELEDSESDELLTARAELKKLEEEYTKAIISSEMDNTASVISSIESGKTVDKDLAASQITGARTTVEKAQKAVETAQKKLDSVKNSTSTSSSSGSSSSSSATSGSSSVISNSTGYGSSSSSTSTSSSDAKNKAALDAAQKNVTAAQSTLANANSALTSAKNNLASKELAYSNALSSEKERKDAIEAFTEAYNAASVELGGQKPEEDKVAELLQQKYDAENVTERKEEIKKVLLAYSNAYSKKNSYASSNNSATIKEYEDAVNAVNSAQAAVTSAENNLKYYEQAYENVQKGIDTANTQKQNSLNSQVAKAEAELETAKAALTRAEEAYKKVTDGLSAELSLSSQYEAIETAKAKVEKLEKEAVGATIEAPVTGTVTDVTLVAGESTAKDQTIVTITPAGKDKTLKFSVTNEQAKKVSLGCQADIVNNWYYNDVTAKLVSIKADPDSPASNKVLTFVISGDVEPGQNINLSVGDKSNTYDFVVPNSAVREDSDGKYILVVTLKDSPLGNRYFATRVDIEVLASDDTKSAIQADVQVYDYVITTASKPIKAGDQVRLYEQ